MQDEDERMKCCELSGPVRKHMALWFLALIGVWSLDGLMEILLGGGILHFSKLVFKRKLWFRSCMPYHEENIMGLLVANYKQVKTLRTCLRCRLV